MKASCLSAFGDKSIMPDDGMVSVARTDCFRLRIVFGEKASVCAEADDTLPDEIKEAIHAATHYAEGRSIDIDVDRREQLETIKRLLKIKYEN